MIVPGLLDSTLEPTVAALSGERFLASESCRATCQRP